MIDYLHRPVCHEAFFKKYASKKFLKGKCLRHHMSIMSTISNAYVASIITRQWAKKYHHYYIKSSLAQSYSSL